MFVTQTTLTSACCYAACECTDRPSIQLAECNFRPSEWTLKPADVIQPIITAPKF